MAPHFKALASFLRRLRGNSPRYKPQLWENLLLALRRKAILSLHSALDERWLDRPHVAGLSEHGLSMELVPRNYYIDGFLFVFGVYEISGTRFFQAVLQPGMTVLDIGANSGYYSLVASRLVGPTGRVHAFEPEDRMRERLKRNLSLNHIDNVEVHRQAVTKHSGEVDFYASKNARNTGISSTLPGLERDLAPRRVQAVALDDLEKEIGPDSVDLVKIDVEGGEQAVIEGARHLLAGARSPTLMFESYDIGTIAPVLEKMGYSVRCLHYSLRNGLEFHRVGEPFEHVFSGYEGVNCVALKERQRFGTFEELTRRSQHKSSRLLRLLGELF